MWKSSLAPLPAWNCGLFEVKCPRGTLPLCLKLSSDFTCSDSQDQSCSACPLGSPSPSASYVLPHRTDPSILGYPPLPESATLFSTCPRGSAAPLSIILTPVPPKAKNSFYFLLIAHQKEGSAFRIFHYPKKYTLHFYFLENIDSCSRKILIFPPELFWILLYIQIVEQIISLIFKDFEKKSVNIRNQFTILTSSHIIRFKDQGNIAREFTKPFITFS